MVLRPISSSFLKGVAVRRFVQPLKTHTVEMQLIIRSLTSLALREAKCAVSCPSRCSSFFPSSDFSTLISRPRFPIIRSYASGNAPEAVSCPVVQYDYVKKLIDSSESPNIIDVREPHERQTDGAIPLTVNIPLGTVPEAFSLDPKTLSNRYGLNISSYDDEIIIHCRSGKRSEDACTVARNAGYRNAKNYKGSMLEWAEKSPKGEQ